MSISIIHGSTADILLQLYKNKNGLQNTPIDNALLKKCVRLDMENAQITAGLSSLTRFQQLSENIAVNLDRLGQLKSTTSLRDNYASKYQQLAGEVVKITHQQDHLAERYNNLIKRQQKHAIELFSQLATNAVSPESAIEAIKILRKETLELSAEMQNHLTQKNKLYTQLTYLYETSYFDLPVNQRPEPLLSPKPEEGPSPTLS